MKKFKPEIEVDSAGTNPAIPISESARKYLATENAEEYLKQKTNSLDEKDPRKYDLIVVMETRHKEVVLSKCSECADRIVVWNIEDPYFLPYGYTEKVFKLIRQKVKELTDST